MTGRLLIASPEDPRWHKHTHAVLKLASGKELRFVDPRRFGRLAVVRIEAKECRLDLPLPATNRCGCKVGPFMALFRGRKTPIKSALLNQKLLSGVGNIYADESLFRAGIRPRRRAASLTHAELRKLHVALQEVLREAIKLGGSSVNDYVDAEGREGFFQLPPPGLWAGGRAMPGMRHTHQAGYHRRAKQSLLSALSEVERLKSWRSPTHTGKKELQL